MPTGRASPHTAGTGARPPPPPASRGPSGAPRGPSAALRHPQPPKRLPQSRGRLRSAPKPPSPSPEAAAPPQAVPEAPRPPLTARPGQQRLPPRIQKASRRTKRAAHWLPVPAAACKPPPHSASLPDVPPSPFPCGSARAPSDWLLRLPLSARRPPIGGGRGTGLAAISESRLLSGWGQRALIGCCRRSNASNGRGRPEASRGGRAAPQGGADCRSAVHPALPCPIACLATSG